jgi:hypothetical protein
MIDFRPIKNKQMNWTRFAALFTKEDLVNQTVDLTNQILDMIAVASDVDVVFDPVDPEAHDPYAVDPDEEYMGWSLGHIIVHITASNEESAFLAAELARGVEVEYRRSRYETHWQTITTIEQVRQRLRESQRMLLASLEMWPDKPHLENFYKSSTGLKITPLVRFLLGQNHADGHLEQIKDVLNQSRAVHGK